MSEIEDNLELIGFLVAIEQVFEDWFNEEDSIYDGL
jgi:hypothetical protein